MDGLAPTDLDQTREGLERAVRCGRCGHALASEKARIEIAGRHAHTFMNPGGVIFDVRCFADVPGAVIEGVPESVTSWFPGTAWTYAHCALCKGHVGWRYVRIVDAPATFFALIVDRLAEQ